MAKDKKTSKKQQGEKANGAAMSATNQMPEPRQLQRGIGTAYAAAVSTLLDKANETAGSKNPFLGWESKVLDPTEYGCHSLLYPKDKK